MEIVTSKTVHKAGIETEHERGPWSGCSDGGRFYPIDPRPDEVRLDVIAHHLAMQVRYNGATTRFYSTAEHSVLCSELALCLYSDDWELALQALLHDAAEAYVGDVVRPVKYQLPEFRKLEDNIMVKAICPRFGLDWPLDERIHNIDCIIAATEKRDLLPGSELWQNMPEPWADIQLLLPISPETGKRLFLHQFHTIMDQLA